MKILKTYLNEIILIKINNFRDSRGDFLKLYSFVELNKLKINHKCKESYISTSKKGTIRGMHYDLLSAKNSKLIYCNKGKMFDVILDIRKKSSNFGKFVTINLNEKDNKLIYIPYGFAHGFQALENQTEVLYFSSAQYNPTKERGILWNSFGCKWPITDKNKIFLSNKDKQHIDLTNK